MSRILIVDDKEEYLRIMYTLLLDAGYTVDMAHHGREALALAARQLPDLVISDLLMPVMDGYMLLRAWKADATLRNIPFIVHTATFTEVEDERLLMNLGADAFIMKPAKTRELLATIKEVAERAPLTLPPLEQIPAGVEEAALKYYSELLVRKLEEKTIQLEEANRALHKEVIERKLGEEELSFNNAILSTQQQASPEGILVVSGEGKVISYNNRFAEIWRLPEHIIASAQETPVMEGTALLKFFTDTVAEPETLLALVKHLYQHRDEKSLDEALLKDGRIIERYSAPAIGVNNRYYGRIWYFQDITERIRAKEALEKSEREQRQLAVLLEIERGRLVLAQQIAKVGSWETNLETLTVIWSELVHRIFETDPASFCPTHSGFLVLVHPEDREMVDKAFMDSLDKAEPCMVEHRLLLPDGRIKYVEEDWQVFRNEAGKPERALGTCRDITDHKLLLESLREQAVQLSNAQRISRMGSWSSDVRTGKVIWTDATCELFGISPEEFRGTYEQFHSFILPEDLQGFDETYANVSPLKPLLEMEFRICRPDDGTVRWMYSRGNVFFDAAGKIISRAGMIMDITEQREVREQLARNTTLLRIAGKVARMGGWSIDTRSNQVYWSDDACVLHDMPPGTSPTLEEAFAYFPGEFRELLAAACQKCHTQGIPFDLELQLLTATGRTTWMRVIGEAVGNPEGKVLQIQGAIQDISEQKAAEDEIHGLGNRLVETLETISDGFLTLDHDWNFTYINAQAERLLQRSRTALLGRNLWTEFREMVGTRTQEYYQHAVDANEIMEFEAFAKTLNKWFEINAYPSNEGLAVYFRDITERKDTDAKLAYLNRVRAVLSGINALIVRTRDRDELFRESCSIAYRAGGFRMVMLCAVNPETLQIDVVASEGKDDALLALIRNTLASEDLARNTMVFRAINGNRAVVANDSRDDGQVLFGEKYLDTGVSSIAVLPLSLQDKAIGALVLYAREIGFFQKDEMALLSELADDIAFAVDHIDKLERLHYLANFDTLTGLANRELFLQRLGGSIRDAAKEETRLAVCLINLERFKNVNDTMGRAVGDTLLRQVAEWLIRNASGEGMLGRVGADHFAVVLPKVKPDGDLLKLFETLARCFQEYTFQVHDQSLRIAAKIGIALYPDDGADADTLFRNAEVALKEARGNNERFMFYTQKMNYAVAAKMLLENQLRQALENEEFVLYYQPKVNLLSGKVVGAEALIRWNDPQGGLVMPGTFIPILEETGLIYDVGRWALRTAINDYLHWRKAGLPAVRVAVNVSSLQLSSRNFVDEIKSMIAVDVHAAEGLELELTESMLMDNIMRGTSNLQAIRELGISIAIDDFGTGFSSLSYLARLPVDTLKIDRSFVLGMTSGPEGLALVSTIINLAHALKLKVVAEGVETTEQSHLLRAHNCDEMQGFVFSKAVPADDFEAKFLRAASAPFLE